MTEPTNLPNVIYSPEEREWSNEDVIVKLTPKDKLSGIKKLEYAWSETTDVPFNWIKIPLIKKPCAYGDFNSNADLITKNRTISPDPNAVYTLRPDGRFGGCVAVEEGTTNIVPDTDMTSSSWTKERGCTVEKLNETLYGIPVYRVTFPAGQLSRMFFDFGYQDGEWFSGSIYYRFVSGHEAQEAIPAFYFRETGFGTAYKGADFQRVTSWQRIELNHQFSGSGSSMFLLYRFSSDTQTDVVMDFAMPQLEKKPFATSFVDGTRPDGILAYSIALKDDYTIACYRKSHTDEDYKHVVKRSDGKVFVDGVEDSGYDVGWIAGRNLLRNSDFSNGNRFWNMQGASGNNIEFKNGYVLIEKIGTGTTPAIYQGTTDIEEEDVTATVWAKGNGVIHARFGNGQRPTCQTVNSDIVKPYSFLINRKGGANRNLVVDVTEGTVEIHFVKLEKGSRATDWTPAPEDFENNILMFTKNTGLLDELTILPYIATEEEIQDLYLDRYPSYKVSQSTKGQWYLHTRIENNSGDIVTDYRGPYKIDKPTFVETRLGTALNLGMSDLQIKLPYSVNEYSVYMCRREKEEEDFHSIVILSDGRVYVDGSINLSYDISWFNFTGDTLTIGSKAWEIMELLIVKEIVPDLKIHEWAQHPTFFHDPAEDYNIQAPTIVDMEVL